MLGETVTVRKVSGEVVVTNRPPRRSAPTEKQAAVQGKFLEAHNMLTGKLRMRRPMPCM